MRRLNNCSQSSFLKLLFAFLTLALFIAAACMPDRADMLRGLQRILSQTAKIPTNFFDSGGYAAAFLNAALVSLLCTGLYCLPGARASAPSAIAFFLTAGFSFWGIHVLNVCFAFPGVLLYCLCKRKAPGTQVNAMLFSAGLAPLISELLLRYPNAQPVGFHWQGFALALGVGLVIGFVLPAGMAAASRVHGGFSLYSAALPLGITAFFLRGTLYTVLGAPIAERPETSLAAASWPIVNLFCIAVFVSFVVLALLMGCKPRDYWLLLKDSGHEVDFSQRYGNAATLMNFGVFGLFIVLCYNAAAGIGGSGSVFNGVTLGCMLCMLSTACSGSHPRNVWPIVGGYFAASFLFRLLFVGEHYGQAINAQAVLIGLCFANGLSPITGRYGWLFGAGAGVLHFLLVTSVPLLHGGFCLYNGGFTAAFVCLAFVPVLTHFFRTKQERLAAKKPPIKETEDCT